MRILAVTVRNVGGLSDGRVELPAGPITALAGANGTGKSKLLACVLSPWTGQIPTAAQDATQEVEVEFRLTEEEKSELQALSATFGWGEPTIPDVVKTGVRRIPLVGYQRFSNPQITVMEQLWSLTDFLSSTPSFNVVYLPAERRLLEPRQQGIDLNQLNDDIAFQKNAETRNAVNNYGRLDDQEFEDFAKALCVAESLPAEEGDNPDSDSHLRIGWSEFQRTVNSIIAPKRLLGLTKEHPDQLRILTPNGDVHLVRDLSSGERQALIIMSRVLRSGTQTPLVLIDEPDAYLHPNLSRRLILALEDGVGEEGQLIVATHSPAILDGVPPDSILRLEHGGPPRVVGNEAERLELYRAAGFRSSALTQADLLVITEGETDISLLTLAVPQLSRAALHAAGGKAQVLHQIEQLKPFDLPVLGIVDRDLNLTPVPIGILDNVFMWPTADIEGVYLSDAASLQAMVDLGLVKSAYSSVAALNALVDRLCGLQRENVVAEIVRSKAVEMSGYEWPSPRGDKALARLRDAVRAATPISEDALDEAIAAAEQIWETSRQNPLSLVRGKYILSAFASEATEMKNGRALLEAIARSRPGVAVIESLSSLVDTRLRDAP